MLYCHSGWRLRPWPWRGWDGSRERPRRARLVSYRSRRGCHRRQGRPRGLRRASVGRDGSKGGTERGGRGGVGEKSWYGGVAVLHATLGSRVQAQTIASRCMPPKLYVGEVCSLFRELGSIEACVGFGGGRSGALASTRPGWRGRLKAGCCGNRGEHRQVSRSGSASARNDDVWGPTQSGMRPVLVRLVGEREGVTSDGGKRGSQRAVGEKERVRRGTLRSSMMDDQTRGWIVA